VVDASIWGWSRREPGVIEFDRGIFIVSYKVNKIDEKFDKIMSITGTLHNACEKLRENIAVTIPC